MIGQLRRSLFGWVGRGFLTTMVMVLLTNRLGVIAGRMQRLMACFAAGKLYRRAPRSAAAEAKPAGGARTAPARIWPLPFGWLVDLMKHDAAVYTVRLETILVQPEMVALLKASPQAALIMRPMCRMLGMSPALLRPGMMVAAAEPTPPTVARPNVARRRPPPIDWGRIPLPRGVLTAARKAGFKPVR